MKNIYSLLTDAELENLSKNAEAMQENEIAIDFGPYLGGSTAAICNGLNRRISNSQPNVIYCYDRFTIDARTTLGKAIGNLQAKEFTASSANPPDSNKIDFKPLFERNLSECAGQILIKAIRCEISDLKSAFAKPRSQEKIKLVHIDLPKTWIGLKPIIEEVFTRETAGAAILWQDYLYHYSADILIACAWMQHNKLLTFNKIVHTTLDSTLIRRITTQEIDRLDEAIKSIDQRRVLLEATGAFLARIGLNEYQSTAFTLATILDECSPGQEKQMRNANSNKLLRTIEANPACTARRIIEVFEDLNGQRHINEW